MDVLDRKTAMSSERGLRNRRYSQRGLATKKLHERGACLAIIPRSLDVVGENRNVVLNLAAVRSLPEERAAELAARTLALPDAQSVEDLTALLTSAGER
jgi:hypothetical protein